MRLENLQDAPRLFEQLFNDRDVDGFVGLYEPDGVLLHEPGRQAVGRSAIRDAVRGVMRERRTLRLNRRSALQSGNLVLASYDWTMSAPEGDVLDVTGRGAIVFRRQPDGAWLTVFDNMHVCE